MEGPQLKHGIRTLALVLCSAFASGSAPADEPSEKRVQLQTRVAIDAPNIRSNISSINIAVIGEGYETNIDLRDYRLRLVVEDRRVGEFSIRIDLFDAQGAVIDSTTVLASPTRPGSFELTSDRVSCSGEVRIVDSASSKHQAAN